MSDLTAYVPRELDRPDLLDPRVGFGVESVGAVELARDVGR